MYVQISKSMVQASGYEMWYVTYLYARIVNFEICIEVEFRTHQPPIPRTSQAAA